MFAVLKTGGKQYRVQPGETLRVEKLAADAGDKVQFNDILMLGGDTAAVGTPFVDGAAVQAEVVDQIKGEKVIHFVKRRRKHGSKRKKGHRQQLTLLRVTDILETGAQASGVKAAVGAGSAPAAGEAIKPATAAEPKKSAAEPDGGGDDLKQLTGVGPAAEAKLREAGLTSFARIAALSEEDIAAIDAIRIKPEWVEQARDLARG